MDVSDDADRLQTLLYSSYSADVVRQLERPLLDDGVPLMRMAASAVARVTLSLLDDEDLDVEDARVTGVGWRWGQWWRWLVCGG